MISDFLVNVIMWFFIICGTLFMPTMIGLFYWYYRDVIRQKIEDDQLHTVAYVNMDVVYETWIDIRYAEIDEIVEYEKEMAKKAQKEFIEERKKK